MIGAAAGRADGDVDGVSRLEGSEVGACYAGEGMACVGEGGGGDDAAGYGAEGWVCEGEGGDGVVADAHGGEEGEQICEGEVDLTMLLEEVYDAGVFLDDFGFEL